MPRTLWMAGLLATTGCFKVTHHPACIEEVEPVSDDFAFDGWTAAELVQRAEGEWAVPAKYDGGAEVEAHVAVLRDGQAEVVRLTETTVEARSLGAGKNGILAQVICEDYLRVPVAVDVQTVDGQVDVLQDGWAQPSGTDPHGALKAFIHAEVPLDEATIPLGDGSPDAYDETAVHTTLRVASSGTIRGDVDWVGSQEQADGFVHGESFQVLSW